MRSRRTKSKQLTFLEELDIPLLHKTFRRRVQTLHFLSESSVFITLHVTARKVSLFEVILVRILLHSDQNNSEYGHFLGSVYHSVTKN